MPRYKSIPLVDLANSSVIKLGILKFSVKAAFKPIEAIGKIKIK